MTSWLAGFLGGSNPVIASSPYYDSREEAAVAALREHSDKQAVVVRASIKDGKPSSTLEIFEVSRGADGTLTFVSFPDMSRL